MTKKISANQVATVCVITCDLTRLAKCDSSTSLQYTVQAEELATQISVSLTPVAFLTVLFNLLLCGFCIFLYFVFLIDSVDIVSRLEFSRGRKVR